MKKLLLLLSLLYRLVLFWLLPPYRLRLTDIKPLTRVESQ